MKNLNPSQGNGRRNGVIGSGLMPNHGPATIAVKVSHGGNQYGVAVPYNSTFGYLKSVIAQSLGLEPEMHKLLFRGQETKDDKSLQTSGVQNNSEMLLMENKTCEQKIPEEVHETSVTSKGDAEVAQIRAEVDKLEQQASKLQAVVDSGAMVDNKEIVYLSEMLMRQLLKLDGIEAEGEGRVQRKMEVRRVQSIVDSLDVLKSRNSNSSSNTNKSVSENTQHETFNPDCESVRSVSNPWKKPFNPGCESLNASPSPMPFPAPSHNMPYFNPHTVPYYDPATMPHHHPSHIPYYEYQSPMPYYYDPSAVPYFTPAAAPYYVPAPMPSSSAPPSMPSSTKVTQDWEHFS